MKPLHLQLLKVWLVGILIIASFFAFRPGALPLQGNTVNGNRNNYAIFMFLSQHNGVPVDNIPVQWRSRKFACMVSKWFVEKVPFHTLDDLIADFATYNAIWFGGALVLLLLNGNGVLTFLGVFASLICNAMPNYAQYVLPWDMPELFFFTLALVLYQRKLWVPLAFAILIGSMFKETVLVCSFFFLDLPTERKYNWLLIPAMVVASQLICKHLAPAGAHLSWTLTFRNFAPANVLKLWPIVFANAGTLFILYYLLIINRSWTMLLAFGSFLGCQCFNNMVYGMFDEFREWTALAPVTFGLLEKGLVTLKPEAAKPEVRKPELSKRKREVASSASR